MKENPNLGPKALPSFNSVFNTHSCELGFSTLVKIKYKKKERMKTVDEMRVFFSNLSQYLRYIQKAPVPCFMKKGRSAQYAVKLLANESFKENKFMRQLKTNKILLLIVVQNFLRERLKL
jgi:hypothetical protein